MGVIFTDATHATDASGVVLTVATNTYVTLAEADTYLAARLDTTAWDAASDDDKARALASATRNLERLPLKFHKTVSGQTLAFPRCIEEHDEGGDDWQYLASTYDDTVVPQAVEDAECEEALVLLDGGNTERATLQRQGVKSFTRGKLSETYGSSSAATVGLVSTDAHALMLPWIAGAVRIARPR